MAGTSSAKTRFALLPGHDGFLETSQKNQCDNGLRRERGLGLFSDRLERRRFGNGEIR